MQNFTIAFSNFARKISYRTGHPYTFMIVLLSFILWVIMGFIVHFSDTWQLTYNTACTIVTFFMVFLIQNTQNRQSETMQLKLDELIRALAEARNAFVNIEDLTVEELDRIKERYNQAGQAAREKLEKGMLEKGVPEIEIK